MLTIVLGSIIALFIVGDVIWFYFVRELVRQLRDQVLSLNNVVDAKVKWIDAQRSLIASLEVVVAQRDEEADLRNSYLDYVFQTFNLHTSTPYVARPNFEDKRCFQCFWPEYAGHAADCAWQHCRPLTEVLYKAPERPTKDSVAAAADIVGPVLDADPELPDASGFDILPAK